MLSTKCYFDFLRNSSSSLPIAQCLLASKKTLQIFDSKNLSDCMQAEWFAKSYDSQLKPHPRQREKNEQKMADAFDWENFPIGNV